MVTMMGVSVSLVGLYYSRKHFIFGEMEYKKHEEQVKPQNVKKKVSNLGSFD